MKYKLSCPSWKLLGLFLLAASSVPLTAQKALTTKFIIETGILPFSRDSENLGLVFNVASKVSIRKNYLLGVRFGLTLNSDSYQGYDTGQFLVDDRSDNGMISVIPDFEYLHKIRDAKYASVGIGLGYFVLPYPIEFAAISFTNAPARMTDGKVKNRLGLHLRGGLELPKIRFGIEHNFIPQGDILSTAGQLLGTVENTYTGLTIGLLIVSAPKSR